jgi:uncharacterized cupredoxin-like copper-binding protein
VDPLGATVMAMTRLPIAALLVGAAGLLAACGGSSGSSTTSSSGTNAAYSAPAATATATPSAAPATATPSAAPATATGHVTTLHLSADPGGALSFTKTALTAKAGTVKIVMETPAGAGMPHGIAIQDHGSGAVVQPGGTSTVTAKLTPGTYTFLCPVPGHAEAGMTGTLTVK